VGRTQGVQTKDAQERLLRQELVRLCAAPAQADLTSRVFAGAEDTEGGDPAARGGVDSSAKGASGLTLGAVARGAEALGESFSLSGLGVLDREDPDLNLGQPEGPAARLQEVLEERSGLGREVEAPGFALVAGLSQHDPAAKGVAADAAQGATGQGGSGSWELARGARVFGAVLDADPAELEVRGPGLDLRLEAREIWDLARSASLAEPLQEPLASQSPGLARAQSEPSAGVSVGGNQVMSDGGSCVRRVRCGERARSGNPLRRRGRQGDRRHKGSGKINIASFARLKMAGR